MSQDSSIEKFTQFQTNISQIELPIAIDYPHNYTPHKIAHLAAKELQGYLATQTDWEHDFNDASHKGGTAIGKMFGVLVVKNTHGELGYLSAFSGKLGESNTHSKFVPPVYDRLANDSFYTNGENELNSITKRITELHDLPKFIETQAKLNHAKKFSQEELAHYRQLIKKGKQERKLKRTEAEHTSNEEKTQFEESLTKQSLDEQFHYKRLAKSWKNQIAELENDLFTFTNQLEQLREERKNKSGNLQERLFESFTFLNQKQEEQSLLSLFKNTSLRRPPAGAGECAAPKLFQHAFKHDLKPIALAEFWWGTSPKAEIRNHGHFYPACKGKCEPILNHMLSATKVNPKPPSTHITSQESLETIFEDEEILIINKPENLLSVPGKIEGDSVYSIIKRNYPNSTGPLIVHRLDMSTSGIMVIALTKDVHKHLQHQFQDRTVKKRYIALLEGIPKQTRGIIELPLRVDLNNRPHQLVCLEHGKTAITKWETIDIQNKKSRVYFYPHTGRTHQLRVHAAHSLGLNTPIVGDDLYGDKGSRLHLHAEYIKFQHPRSKLMIEFNCEADF